MSINSRVMETIKYKVIKSEKQYDNYCSILEKLVFGTSKNKFIKDEIDLLTLLIQKWDSDHSPYFKSDPITVLKGLMKDHSLKSVQLARLLDVSEGLISDMLSYKKGLSKENIRILSDHFKLNQAIFNKYYKLTNGTNPKKRKKTKSIQ